MIAGVLWTAFSPGVVFLWLAGWMLAAVVVFLTMPNDVGGTVASETG